MEPMIVFCGLDCSECPAYVATQANDRQAQEELLARWRVEFNSPDMPLEAVMCDGCSSVNGRHGGYCGECPVRACAIEHEVENCGYCASYEGCETLKPMLTMMPAAVKERLDLIHSRN